jgi:DNA-binding transcriptional regulator/RsmH inhibitor MraZ
MPFGFINGMKTSVSIDKAGRVVLPQHVRRQFHAGTACKSLPE